MPAWTMQRNKMHCVQASLEKQLAFHENIYKYSETRIDELTHGNEGGMAAAHTSGACQFDSKSSKHSA